MNLLSLDRTVGQLVAERPARARVFERLGIDYCCGGRNRLGAICDRELLDRDAVLCELEVCDLESSADDQADWSQATLARLVDHIMAIHHAYLREALPRLALLIEKTTAAHSERHPELTGLRQLFAEFHASQEAHMDREERELFPACRARDTGRGTPGGGVGSLDRPIELMKHEHDDVARSLGVIRDLLDGFTPPADAGAVYRAMLHGLSELEVEMQYHVHEENNLLFPMARYVAARRTAPQASRSPA